MAKINFNKSGSCSSNTNYNVSSNSNRALDETLIIRDFMKSVLSGERDMPSQKDLIDEVSSAYPDNIVDEISETQEFYAKSLAGQIYRCAKTLLCSLNKEDEIICPQKFTLDLHEGIKNDFVDSDNIDVSIDVIILNKERQTAHAIVFKRGIPKLGKTASAYINVNNDIDINLKLLALENFVTEFIGDKTYRLCASYYYMKKTSDNRETVYVANYDDTQIREVKENFKKGQENHKNFVLSLIDKWSQGYDKCDMKEQEDCKSCSNYFMCYYSLAPKDLSGEVSHVKVRKECTPTPEQQAVINARDGIFLCQASPGSGKTETAIKQRTVSIILDELDKIVKDIEDGKDDLKNYLNSESVFVTNTSERIEDVQK